MRKLLKRWYVWLGLVLLLGFAGSAALICALPSRITQENFDRIRDGTTEAEVEAILGPPSEEWFYETDLGVRTGWRQWNDGPTRISVHFHQRMARAETKIFHNATTWETMQWYAKKGAAKIGITWR